MCWVILPLTALPREGYSLQCSASSAVNEQGQRHNSLSSDLWPLCAEARARVLSESSRGSPFTARHSKRPPIPWGASLWTSCKFSSSRRRIPFWHKPVMNCSVTPSDAWKRTLARVYFARCFYAGLSSKSHSQEGLPRPENNGEAVAKVEVNQKPEEKLLGAAQEADPAGKSTKIKYVNLY